LGRTSNRSRDPQRRLVMCRLGLEATGRARLGRPLAWAWSLVSQRPWPRPRPGWLYSHHHCDSFTNHNGHTINSGGRLNAWAYEVRPLFLSYFLSLTFSCRPPPLRRLNPRRRGFFCPPTPLPRSNTRWRGFLATTSTSTSTPHSLEREMAQWVGFLPTTTPSSQTRDGTHDHLPFYITTTPHLVEREMANTHLTPLPRSNTR
jgi:hypothetical protein